MLAKGMHRIAQIEFENSSLPQTPSRFSSMAKDVYSSVNMVKRVKNEGGIDLIITNILS